MLSTAFYTARSRVANLTKTRPADDPELTQLRQQMCEQFLVDSSDPLFRDRLRAGVGERDAALAGTMGRAGVPLHRVDTDRDLVRTLVEVVTSTRWRRA